MILVRDPIDIGELLVSSLLYRARDLSRVVDGDLLLPRPLGGMVFELFIWSRGKILRETLDSLFDNLVVFARDDFL